MAEPEDPFGAPKPPTPYRYTTAPWLVGACDGYDAARDHSGKPYHCPYRPGSIAARAWRAGYRHVYTTIRLDPDQPLRSDR